MVMNAILIIVFAVTHLWKCQFGQCGQEPLSCMGDPDAALGQSKDTRVRKG